MGEEVKEDKVSTRKGCGAAWCCVMLRDAAWCCVVLRGAAWCCVGCGYSLIPSLLKLLRQREEQG